MNPPPIAEISDPAARPPKILNLPLSKKGASAVLQVPFPLTTAEWEKMEKILDVMKDSLIDDDAAVNTGAQEVETADGA